MNRIIVFGLGAIGSNLTTQLIKKYPDINITGVDFDKVEDRNVGPQAYFNQHVGHLKALAMKSVLSTQNRKFNYTPHPYKIESVDDVTLLFGEESILMIDCFDNTESRNIFMKMPKDLKILHVGFSPAMTAEVIWQNKYDVPGDVDSNLGDICEMTEAVSFINYVVSFASLVIGEFLDTGVRRSFLITNKFKIQEI